ncbi:unannotated protein [freshwater metagenome]|uniref:Unannotated protein n=1 Tax=freshwater metagenome TaxID=449393 RepID=A0A6J6G2X1_9ZZZZ
MKRRHRSRRNTASESIPHHELCATTKRFDEWAQIGEVVAVIGIPHDDKRALRVGDTCDQCSAIPACWYVDDTSAFTACNVLRTIGASVVSDNNFTINSQFVHRSSCLTNTDRKGLRLVEAREDDAEFHECRYYASRRFNR